MECDMVPYLSTPCRVSSSGSLIPLLSLNKDPTLCGLMKYKVSPSSVILSRVCVNYLANQHTFMDWTVCPQHRDQLLVRWSAGNTCCHHEHTLTTAHMTSDTNLAMSSVSHAMSKTILRQDGMVLPIGGAICLPCKKEYQRKHIPALTSISDHFAKQEKNKQTLTPDQTPVSPGTMTNAEILQKIKSLQSIPIQSLPAHFIPYLSQPPHASTVQLADKHKSNDSPTNTIKVEDGMETGDMVSHMISDKSQPILSSTSNREIIQSQQHVVTQAKQTLASSSTTSPTSSSHHQIGGQVHQQGVSQELVSHSTHQIRGQTPLQVSNLSHQQIGRQAHQQFADRQISSQPIHQKESPSNQLIPSATNQQLVSPVQQQISQQNQQLKNQNKVQNPSQNNQSLLHPQLVTINSPEMLNCMNQQLVSMKDKPLVLVINHPQPIIPSGESPSPQSQQSVSVMTASETSTPARSSVTPDATSKSPSPDDSSDFQFYCNLCHIGFLKDTSYKFHMTNNVEVHKKMEANKLNNNYKCDECGAKLKDDKSYRQHLYQAHKIGDNPFYCDQCHVLLKNESAYKSHHSKLHLERRNKIFYCRECDEIFHCMLKHKQHIRKHFEEVKEEGFQCPSCGKIFGVNQRLPYKRHLATHDDDNKELCSCKSCAGKSIIVNNSQSPIPSPSAKDGSETKESKSKKRKAGSAGVDEGEKMEKRKQPKRTNRMNLMKSMQKNFVLSTKAAEEVADDPDESNSESNEEDAVVMEEIHDEFVPDSDEDNSDEEEDDDSEWVDEPNQLKRQNSRNDLNVNCGVCGSGFDNVDELQKHVEEEHSNKRKDDTKNEVEKSNNGKFIAKEGGWTCNLCNQVMRTSRELKSHRSKKECPLLKSVETQMRNTNKSSEEGKVGNDTADTEKENISTNATSKSSVEKLNTNSNAPWQQSESRNWAAEFGYGKKPLKSADLLAAMKAKFVTGDKDGDENEEEEGCPNNEDEAFRKRGFQGRIKATLSKAPRTLSQSSRQTRRRLEVLTKKAQDFMKRREAGLIKSKTSVTPATQLSASQTISSQNVTNEPCEPDKQVNEQENDNSSEDEEFLDADISNEDDLLIPLANGWVCEKRRDRDVPGGYVTHYWSPEGDHFRSKQEIEKYVMENDVSVDLSAFDAADIRPTVPTEINGSVQKPTGVRVKDETGLPMVIIFPEGRDCLTMDVSTSSVVVQ